MKKYPVAVLCGSTRFKEEFDEARKNLTLEGFIVIAGALFIHSTDSEEWERIPEDSRAKTKHMLDNALKQKIDMADCLYVVNPNGYIGKSTWAGICYAWMIGRKIRFLDYIPESEIRRRVNIRIEVANEFAWQNIESMRQEGENPDMSMHPCFKHKGKMIYDPWVAPEKNYDTAPWADHEDKEHWVDPFKTYGKKNAARFIEDLLYLYGMNDFYRETTEPGRCL